MSADASFRGRLIVYAGTTVRWERVTGDSGVAVLQVEHVGAT
ncbi:hypothetical protein [Amycolatopsis regifaucium]|nr:hypothetical protein [Amycolatopsis regifaucium]